MTGAPRAAALEGAAVARASLAGEVLLSRAVDEDGIDFAGPLILVLLLSPGVLKVGAAVGAGLTGCAAAVGGGGVSLEAAAVP